MGALASRGENCATGATANASAMTAAAAKTFRIPRQLTAAPCFLRKRKTSVALLRSQLTLPPPVKRTILLLSLLSLLQSLVVCFILERRFPNSGDEHSYLFQARLFASGRLTAADPLYERAEPLNRYLAAFCITDFHGKRFSEYQPGWPMVLALGVAAGAEWLVAPLLGALLVFLMLSYAARRLGPDLVVPVWTLVALCSFFWFNSASLRAHTLTALCIFAAY